MPMLSVFVSSWRSHYDLRCSDLDIGCSILDAGCSILIAGINRRRANTGCSRSFVIWPLKSIIRHPLSDFCLLVSDAGLLFHSTPIFEIRNQRLEDSIKVGDSKVLFELGYRSPVGRVALVPLSRCNMVV